MYDGIKFTDGKRERDRGRLAYFITGEGARRAVYTCKFRVTESMDPLGKATKAFFYYFFINSLNNASKHRRAEGAELKHAECECNISGEHGMRFQGNPLPSSG